MSRTEQVFRISDWILEHVVELWLLFSLTAYAGWIFHSTLIFGLGISAIAAAVPFVVLSAIRHVFRAARWCRDITAGFPPVRGNPRAPDAFIYLIVYLLCAIFFSELFFWIVVKFGVRSV